MDAKLIIKLLDALAAQVGGKYPEACREMDHRYGSMWREEVKAAGLEHKLHEEEINTKEKFYADIKRRLNLLSRNEPVKEKEEDVELGLDIIIGC